MAITQPTIAFQALVTSTALNTAFGTFTTEINRIGALTDTPVGGVQGASQLVKTDAAGTAAIAQIAQQPSGGFTALSVGAQGGYTGQYVNIRDASSANVMSIANNKAVAFGGTVTSAGSMTATGGFVGSGAGLSGLGLANLGDLAVTANGTNLTVTIAPGTATNGSGNPRRSIVNQTISLTGTDGTGFRWTMVGLSATLTPTEYIGAYNSGPETIAVPAGAFALRLVFMRANTTVINTTDTGTQGFLSDPSVTRLVPALATGAGASTGSSFITWQAEGTLTNSGTLATELSGASARGSYLPNIKGAAAQGSLFDAWTLDFSSDILTRLQGNGANGIILYAGTALGQAGPNSPFSLAIGGRRITVTAPLTATAAGAINQLRYAVLDISSGTSMTLTLQGPGWVQGQWQIKIAAFWWDGTNLFPASLQGVYFDRSPMASIFSHMVFLDYNEFPSSANDTLATNLAGAVAAFNHPVQNFTLPGTFKVKVTSHARALVTAGASGSDFAEGFVFIDGQSGPKVADMILRVPSTQTTGTFDTSATDCHIVPSLGPGVHTIGMYWQNSQPVTLYDRKIILEYFT